MSYSVSFWNFMAERYAKSPIVNMQRYQQKLEATQSCFNENMEVFEFGCGTGMTAILHAPFVKSYLATDVSPKMLEIAKRKPESKTLNNLTFQQLAIEEWPDEEEKFDVILGLSILHLLNDPDKVIEKVHKMLKPNGIFITSTTCIMDAMPWFRFVAPIGSFLGIMPKLQFFTFNEIEQRINQAGFVTKFMLPKAENSDACFLISSKITETSR